MTLAFYAPGETAPAELAAADSFATLSALSALYADPDAESLFLVEIAAFDLDAGAAVDLYYATGEFATEPGDTPASQPYRAVVQQALEFERSLYRAGSIGGRSEAGFGQIVLVNAEADLDAWEHYAIDGRAITVRMGGPNFAYDDFGIVFKGIGDSVEFDTGVVRLNVRDRQFLFDVGVAMAIYAGTGGSEGGPEVEGKTRPRGWGVVHNASPAPYDTATPRYQAHYGSVDELTEVRDKGSALTQVMASPGVGEWLALTGSGVIELGNDPNGQVTVDFKGDDSGGYVETTADIVESIALNDVGLTAGDLNAASFADVNLRNSAAVGIYVAMGENPTAADLIDSLMNGIGGFWGMTRLDTLQIGIFSGPGTPVETYTEKDIDQFERLPTEKPIWRWRQGYQINYTIQPPDSLASGVSNADKATWSQPMLIYGVDDTSVQTAHLLAVDPEPALGHFDLRTDAKTEAERRLALFGGDYGIYRVRVRRRPFARNLNDTVLIEYPRYGFSAGRTALILTLRESAAAGTVEMEVFVL